MDLTIHLSSEEEARLAAAARREGLDPAEWLKRVALGRLSSKDTRAGEEIDAKLRRWQEQDGAPLSPHVPAHELLARWDEEDALMTDEEREAEDRLWEDLEK